MGKGRYRHRRIHGIYHPPGTEPDDIEPLPEEASVPEEDAVREVPPEVPSEVQPEAAVAETLLQTPPDPAVVEEMFQLLQSVSKQEAKAELASMKRDDPRLFEAVSLRLKDAKASTKGKDIS